MTRTQTSTEEEPREDTRRRQHLQAKKRDLRRNQPHPHLDLGLLASGSGAIKFLLLKPPDLCDFVDGPSRLGHQITSRKKASTHLRNGGGERNRSSGQSFWRGSLTAGSGKGWFVQGGGGQQEQVQGVQKVWAA